MKISSVSAIIGSFCLLLQGQAIASQVSFSSLLRVPAVQNTCELEAQSLQNKIASVRGVSEAQVECRGTIELEEKGTTYKLYSLNIQYKAPVALPYTANFAADQLQVPIGSLYPAHQSYGECLLALEDQKKIFERETKLEAVVSACQRVEFSSETLYTIRIEGFGKPEKTLQYAGIKVSPLNHSQLYTEVEKLFGTQGLSIVSKFNQVYFFYSKNPVYLHHLSPMYFESMDQCKSQLPNARDVLVKAANTNIVSQCEPAVDSVVLYTIGIGSKMARPPFVMRTHRYYTFNECVQDRSRLLSQYAKWAYGVVCSPDVASSGQYLGQVFERY